MISCLHSCGAHSSTANKNVTLPANPVTFAANCALHKPEFQSCPVMLPLWLSPNIRLHTNCGCSSVKCSVTDKICSLQQRMRAEGNMTAGSGSQTSHPNSSQFPGFQPGAQQGPSLRPPVVPSPGDRQESSSASSVGQAPPPGTFFCFSDHKPVLGAQRMNSGA